MRVSPLIVTAFVLPVFMAAGVAAQMHDPAGHPHGMSGSEHKMPMMQGGAAHGTMGMKMGDEVPAGLDTARAKPSDHHLYRVSITPKVPALSINRMHQWLIDITTPDGRPVEGARIAVDGGMPAHGHGLPTSPRMTRELGGGKYLIDGVKFNMTGWWELKFAIDDGHHKDRVTFNLVLK